MFRTSLILSAVLVVPIILFTVNSAEAELRVTPDRAQNCLSPAQVNSLLRKSGLPAVNIRGFDRDNSSSALSSCSCSDPYIKEHCSMCGACSQSGNKCACTCFGGIKNPDGDSGTEGKAGCKTNSDCPKGQKCRDGKCGEDIILKPCDDPLCNIDD